MLGRPKSHTLSTISQKKIGNEKISTDLSKVQKNLLSNDLLAQVIEVNQKELNPENVIDM